MKKLPHPAHPLLLVDDEKSWTDNFSSVLGMVGLNHILVLHRPEEVLPLLDRQPVELVILDVGLPGISGERLLEEIHRHHPEIPVLMLTALEELDVAVRCMQLGAVNYLTKDTHKSQLVAMVHQTLSARNLQRVNGELQKAFFSSALRSPEAFSRFVTSDHAMHLLFQYIEAVAESPEPLLITGETGTGKELVARALHTRSLRPGPLVAVNVAGLDDEAFSDTLFGHLRGAFTGAVDRRGGMIERAENGTLFLDEIGDLNPGSQVKLLRLLQEGEYLPLGADVPRRCDIRIVAATHQDLAALQREGKFRKDLYYRLRTHHVHVPSLRERPGDIPLLMQHFLSEACLAQGRPVPEIPPETMQLFKDYPFPGNVRELRALLHDAVSRQQSEALTPNLFSGSMAAVKTPRQPRTPADLFNKLSLLPTLKEVQELLVAEALRRTNHNQSAAAELIGISRQAMNQRVKR